MTCVKDSNGDETWKGGEWRYEREVATTDRQGFRLGIVCFMNQPLVALQIGLSGTWQPVETKDKDYLYILVSLPFPWTRFTSVVLINVEAEGSFQRKISFHRILSTSSYLL